MGELMPCPFCGNQEIGIEEFTYLILARCQNCRAAGGHVFDDEGDFSKETVLLRWNTRKEPVNENE